MNYSKNIDATEFKCTKCHIVKPVSEFYGRSMLKRGFSSTCIPCHKEISRIQYQKYKARKMAKNEEYRLANKERLGAKARERYAATPKEIHKARSAVAAAIKSRKLVKLACEICGNTKSDFHHTDGYDEANQLIGKWLCRLHHAQAHVKMREAQGYSEERKKFHYGNRRTK